METQSHWVQWPRTWSRSRILIFPLLILTSQWVSADVSSFHELSPVYEEMLANQVDQLRRELVQYGQIDKSEPFWVAGWDRASGVIALEVIQSLLKRKFKFKNWRYADVLPSNDFHGVVLFSLSAPQSSEELMAEIEAAIRFTGNEPHVGFLVIFVPNDIARKPLEVLIQQCGSRIRYAIPERELEFVKDASGRQIVHLDDDRFRLKIYARFVQKGMNPVLAMPASVEAIRRFRTSENRTILVVERS